MMFEGFEAKRLKLRGLTHAVWIGDPVTGQAVESGHFLPEEAPEVVLAQLLPFLTAKEEDLHGKSG